MDAGRIAASALGGVLAMLVACDLEQGMPALGSGTDSQGTVETTGAAMPNHADVLTVGFGGGNLDYQVSPTIRSPDLGCEQYVDWWEVITPQGELIFRRTFESPHIDEQPFTDIVQHVPIESDVPYIYRAHMFPDGYGGAYRFQTQTGQDVDDPTDYASMFPELADKGPQPPPCTD
jgi:hypothetical protein